MLRALHGVELSGPIEVTLHVSSDATDTDSTVKLLRRTTTSRPATASGSRFEQQGPRFDSNLNTGRRNYDETEGVVARNAVHHRRRYPFQATLTVVEK